MLAIQSFLHNLLPLEGTGTGTTPTTPATYTDVADGRLYRVHVWLGDGSFTVTYAGAIDYLVIAGGGGGGTGDASGGGGAGGMRTESGFGIPADTYAITVGPGGAGATNGSPSSIGTLIVSTGGGAGANEGNNNGGNGGSGGGATYDAGSSPGTGINDNNIFGTETYQGHRGGQSALVAPNHASGGGGGAGAVGATAVSSGQGGPGGAGRANFYRDGNTAGNAVATHIYGGGGGGASQTGTAPIGGSGGGGHGSIGGATNALRDGIANSGGGGGGRYTSTVGVGGSGIVIIRYLI